MTPTAEITTTEQEIVIRIPRYVIEKKSAGKISITHLRGLMRRSRLARIGSVTAQHAACKKEEHITS